MTTHRKNSAAPEEKDAAPSEEKDAAPPDDWENRIAKFWKTADDTRPEWMLETMNVLRQELPDSTPDALFEWASVHDFLGRESQAVPLYEQALNNGVAGARKCRAAIQLASSLRNVGRAQDACKLLENFEFSHEMKPAAAAFQALALRDCGQSDAALQVALQALATLLPQYGAAVEYYAGALVSNSV